MCKVAQVQQSASTAAPVRAGRPRDPSRDEAIRSAALDLLVELGYDRVTIEAIAARAGAGKATVYRRWGSKAELVLDAITDLGGVVRAPDTGSLAGDLSDLCTAMSGRVETHALAVMHALAPALARDAELAAAFAKHFVAPRRAALADVFARATARGEMPAGKDIDLLTSVIPALMMYRLSTGGGIPDPQLVRRIASQVLLPAALAAPGSAHAPTGAAK